MKQTIIGSDINLNVNKSMMDITSIFGKSEQKSRSGKNVLNINSTDVKMSKIASSNISDSILSLVKDTSSITGATYYIVPITLEANANYIITGKVKISNNTATGVSTIGIREMNNGGSWITQLPTGTIDISSTNEQIISKTFNSGNYTNAYFWFYVDTSNSADVATLSRTVTYTDFMVRKVETSENYEQYGASPSPEFPSPIENVEGWNKFDKNSVTNGYYLNESGNLIVSANYCVSDFIKVEEGEKYFIPKRNTSRTKYYLSDKTAYSSTWDVSDAAQVITIPAGVKYIRFTILIAGSGAVDLNTFQFTEGSEEKPYAPYNSLVIEDVGNNLFDNNKVLRLNKLSYENGVYSASDNDTRAPLQYKIQQYTENNTFLGATTQVTKVISNIGRYYFTGIKAEDAAFVKIANNGAVREFTLYHLLDDIAVGEKFTVVLNVIDTTIGASKFKDVMLLKGEITEADYEKHKSQTEYFPLAEPLRGLPNEVKDTIKEDGIHIRVGTGVFQAVTQLYESSNGLKYGINLLDTYGVNTENSNINILCDKAIGVPLPRKENIIYITNNRTLVIFGSADDTVETFNEKFAGAEYQYELAEEVVEPFTAEQQEAWDNMQGIYLFDGTNNISIMGSIKPSMEITYYSIMESFDFYISSNGYFVVPEYGINYLIDLNASSIPSMPEATEASARIAGRDGDVVLNTTYEPMSFNIVCYTLDNLTQAEKVLEEQKMNLFMDSIKNKFKTFAIEKDSKFYKVKYNAVLTTINFPAHLQFTIPLKSSESYAKDLIEKNIVGNNSGTSNTIKEVGGIFTIKGPAQTPKISFNNYEMFYDNVILENNKLIIDTLKSTVTLENSEGKKTNAMRYYNHQFPKIKNGENTLAINSGIDDDSQVTLKWYDLKL